MTKLVALALPGGPQFVAELQRVWEAGDVVFPVDMRLPSSYLDRIFERVGVNEIIDEEGASHYLPGPRLVELGDAIVVATSGTTGEPKGVIHTHDSVRASAHLTSAALGVTSNDHWLACLPLAHIGGLSVVIRALVTDTKLTVLPRFDVAEVESAARNGASLVSLVNTALRRVDTDLFRKILLGGSAPLVDRPANTVSTYGMSETGSGVVYNGLPLDDVKVMADDSGQLLISSPTLLRAYTDGTDPKTHDGWLPTGDAGAVEDDGTVRVFGRMDDVIVTGGEKVWPAEVESILKLHFSVADAKVFGLPDPEWDERVVAHIELVSGSNAPSLEALRELVKQHTAAFKAPRELQVVGALERTSTGKIRRQIGRAD